MFNLDIFQSISNEFRAVLWRVGRKSYRFARGDRTNNPETNGEYWLQSKVIGAHPRSFVVVDVGANRGEWTLHALDLVAQNTSRISVYAFEPSSSTRTILEERLAHYPGAKVIGKALSSVEGEAWFYTHSAGAGINSLSEASGEKKELVETTTVDAFVAQAGMTSIDMIKIDTEGFDFEVLRGAERSLNAGMIEVVQFEYNWRWLINHVALRDVFTYIKDKPYHLGKLASNTIELFSEWHFEMDRYFENNYVLLRQDSKLLNDATLVRFDARNCARRVGKLRTANLVKASSS